jgi:uncharacterized protein (UPF0332 family)
MSDEAKKANIRRELERAAEALRAADALVGLGLNADAVSRAYYAAFHLVLALLFSRGVEPKTHAGALHLLNVELVRNGLVASSHNRLLAGLQRARELADYDSAATFSTDDARAIADEARAFGEDARALLAREGWIEPE